MEPTSYSIPTCVRDLGVLLYTTSTSSVQWRAAANQARQLLSTDGVRFPNCLKQTFFHSVERAYRQDTARAKRPSTKERCVFCACGEIIQRVADVYCHVILRGSWAIYGAESFLKSPGNFFSPFSTLFSPLLWHRLCMFPLSLWLYIYSEASVIAVIGDRDHPRKLKIREEVAPL